MVGDDEEEVDGSTGRELDGWMDGWMMVEMKKWGREESPIQIYRDTLMLYNEWLERGFARDSVDPHI